jgi:ribosomal protein L16 Arg81 hydroxylase
MRKNSFDEKFWTRFAKNYWEQKPLVLKKIQSDLLELSDNEVFNLIVAAADQSRRDRSPLGFKFFVNGIRSSDTETLFVLPRRSDRTLLQYNQRMERIYQDYCLVCDELLQVNKDKQFLLNQFTHQLYQHVGFPNRFAEMGLYLGNYRKTPFGVHVDRCGVFSFPIVGRKKFRAWTSDYVRKNPNLDRSFRYTKHKSASQVLEASVGDMTYWPSSYWHIAESDGSFSATWSLGIWVDRLTRETIGETLLALLSEKMGGSMNEATVKIFAKDSADGQILKLPEVFDRAISVLRSLSKAELENSFRQIWMKRIAGHGMKTLARDHGAFRLGKVLKIRHTESPILWTLESAANSTGFSFCFGDVATQVSTSKRLLKLIKDLNAGGKCVVNEYLGGSQRADDLRAIRLLGEAGAFLS